MNVNDLYNTADIYALTGVDRGRIHYYVQLGLLKPLFRRGNTTFFDELAVDRVKTIRMLQDSGHSLGEISRRFKEKTEDEKDSVLETMIGAI